jgi:von Willebrand factor type A domain
MLASMTLLTPLGALVAAAVVLPVAAIAIAARRTRAVRIALRLRAPRGGTDLLALAALVGVFVLLALAATQPALSHDTVDRVRTDAQALFVLDTSRSMAAASTRSGPTRLARAKDAAAELRASIPDVESGIATLTDRVLPDLLPVPDIASFDATLQRAVGIEEPPPQSSGVRATTYTALAGIPASGFFAPAAKQRVIVLLTDGESVPFDPGEIARALARTGVVVMRFWSPDESVFGAAGRPETAYRPDPGAPAALDALAAATGGGRAFGAGQIGAAAARLRALLGRGPTSAVVARTRRETPLAPYVALAALLPLTLLVARRSFRGVRSTGQ